MFKGLTPSECAYLAGNYRGANFGCLIDYAVEVQGDRTVGTPPEYVLIAMAAFGDRVSAILNCLQAASAKPNSVVPEEQKLLHLVVFAAEIHEEFLRIHPYANGNGHMGRLIVWCLLGVFGYWPKSWPLDDRPEPQNEYGQCLMAYRAGSKEPLIQFMLKRIVGDS